MKIQTQITLLGLALTVATAGLIAGVMFVKQTAMQQRIAGMTKDVDTLRGNVERDQVSLMESSISQQAMALLQSVEASDRRTSTRLSHSMSIAQEQLAALGPIQFATETVAWACVNQTTKETRELTLPRVLAGTTWLGQNATTNEASPVVDFVRRNTRDYCTVFQRMNDEGDMLRVCTSVLKPDGSRAIGTYIPYAAPDGTPSPVLATVLAGKTYLGSARVYDQWHTATYEPIWDQAHQKVIGMLYVGVNTTDVNRQLRESLQQVAIGKTGYVFVLGGKGSQRGVYLVSKGGKRDGENIWEAKDSTGRLFIQSIVNQAMAATNGEPVLERYGWQNAGEPASRQKIAAAVYYAPMDWVIAASCYEDDFLESQKLVAQSTGAMLGTVQQTVADLKSALWWILGSALLVILCALVVSHLLARSLSRPLNAGVQFAHELAGGNLRGRMDASQKNEVGLLGRSLNEMVDQLRQTVQKLRRSSSSVASSSHSLSAVSAQVSSNSEETSAQANVVAAAAEQVSKNITTVATAAEELTATVREIAKQTSDATRVASEAVQMADATNVTISKLGVSSSQIGSVVKVITSIAEQTNLLALNATIEAARAGEAGKGFAVVANEVKELARQTSKATEEISSRISSIQEDTANAVSAIGAIGNIISQINQIQTTIAGSVEEQAVTTNEISKNASEAAGGAADIARNITSVSQAAQSSLQAATNTRDAASELARLADELRSVVATFQVEEAEPSSPKPQSSSPPAVRKTRSTPALDRESAGSFHSEFTPLQN